MPSVTILYFAAASTATGVDAEIIAIPPQGLPLSKLSAQLVSLHPNSKLEDVLRASQWSVDAEMVEDPEAVVLKGGEEVAVICPVSGG